MLYVDIPTLAEIKALVRARSDACLSIFVATTPETQHVEASRIAFRNLVREGVARLRAENFDKRRLALIEAECQAISEDDEFWRFQARSLVLLATPDNVRTFRLATAVNDSVQVADRFQIKPLLRAVAFPQTAFVLALSENAAELFEVSPDSQPTPVPVPDLPKSAADAAGRASINNLSQGTRVSGREGQTLLLHQYARKVDAALRPVLRGTDLPLILASTQPLAPIFRSINSYPKLLPEGIVTSPDRLTAPEIARAARPVLDGHYRAEIDAARALYSQRDAQRRATTNIGDIGRAATAGAIESILVDIEASMSGTVSDEGKVSLASDGGPATYDVIDELVGRAILADARFLGVRAGDVPGGAAIAATLRYPL
jgi:hypothetical protein